MSNFYRLAILVLVGLLSACKQDGKSSDKPQAPNKHQGSFVVNTGEVAEICPSLQTKQSLSIEIESSEQAAFNLHYHQGDEVSYPIKAITTSKLAQTIVADHDGVYCLMWTGLKDQSKVKYSYWIE